MDATGPGAPLHTLDASAQAALVASGELTARELAEAAIARIERLNPEINAVIHPRYEAALAEADAYDRSGMARAAPAAPGFGGVPFLVKDLDGLRGAPQNFGSVLFRHFRAWSDEPLIGLLRAHGVIALGKSNTPEFGLIGATEPLLHGPTRNPWDLTLSAGGSSGGAAAAVASGMVPIAHASDGGGSIRIPASACGMIGLKPSRGRGVPLSRPTPGAISVALCVSRSVRDTARFLEISDAARIAQGLPGAPAPVGFVAEPLDRPLRIALSTRAINGKEAEPEVGAATLAAARLCESLGHQVEEARPALDAEAATRHFLAIWSSIPSRIKRLFFLIRAYAAGPFFWRWPPYEEALDPWTRGLADMFDAEEARDPGQVERALAFFEQVSHEYERFFRRYDVALTPVLRRASFPIGEQAPTIPFETLMERASDNVGYTPPYNALGLPAISLPLGWSAAGTPIGVQFGAGRYQERLLLELAYQLEAAQPWAGRWPALS